MTITREQLNDMKLAAAMCDDFTQYRKEVREIHRLEARLKIREGKARREPVRSPVRATRRVPEGHIRCGSFREAMSALDALCGV